MAVGLRQHPGLALERDGGYLTALQCAAGSRLPNARTIETAAMLLDAGAQPRVKTRSWGHDVDAAYFAAGANNRAIYELLLDRGADPTASLPHAVWSKHFELAGIALARGAQPDRAISGGRPLLNDLIRWGQIPQVKWLLEHGASPNVPDGDGWTAAHQAASRGNAQLFRAVIDAGADLTRRDKQRNTPRDIARLMNRTKLL